ncbi:Hypothetical_protein [Hexamita inflata]|uniref:Hypothetical_protein n=1 Tax=Hexamita inflata TaxID=28002 RepID=A0AA86RQA0_9EUKA|nr:Hypothetical protein HINF_LOCUS58300 [Hexamita inflata]
MQSTYLIIEGASYIFKYSKKNLSKNSYSNKTNGITLTSHKVTATHSHPRWAKTGEGRATTKKPIHRQDKQIGKTSSRCGELGGLQLQQWKLLALLRAAAQEGIQCPSNRSSKA